MYRTVQSVKRAEPATARGQLAHKKILRAAADLIHAQGAKATSLDTLLAATRTGKSQFYHYFTSKEDLVRQVLAYQFHKLAQEQGALLERLDTWQGIERWFTFILNWQRRRHFLGGCPIGSLAAEMADYDDQLRTALAAAFDSWCGFLKRGLATMRSRGELRRDADPKALAEATFASIQGVILLSKTKKRAAPLQNALTGAMACLRFYAQQPSHARRMTK
jgi:AcrR family transcriptional regulator